MADGPTPLNPRTPLDAIFDPTNTELLAEHEETIAQLWAKVVDLERLVRKLLAGNVTPIAARNQFAPIDNGRLALARQLREGTIDAATFEEATRNLDGAEARLMEGLADGGVVLELPSDD